VSVESNKELVRRLYEEAFNHADLDLVDELAAAMPKREDQSG
jgi:hypothetical protein